MKVKFFYPIGKRTGKLWHAPFCEVIDYEKYDENYDYLANSVWELRFIEDIDRE